MEKREKNSQPRSPGQSNRHSGSESRQTAPPTPRRPCRRPRHGARAANTPGHASRRDKAIVDISTAQQTDARLTPPFPTKKKERKKEKKKTHILNILIRATPNLGTPPKMASGANRAALIGLLEQLAAVQRGLRDERVEVLGPEAPRAVQAPRDAADGLELRARVADALLVDGEGLREELVAHLLEARLVGDLACG